MALKKKKNQHKTYPIFPRFAEGPAFRRTEAVSFSGQYLKKNWAVRAESVRVIHNYVSGTRTTNFAENFKDSAQKLHPLSMHPFPSPLLLRCQKLNMPHLPVSWRMKKRMKKPPVQQIKTQEPPPSFFKSNPPWRAGGSNTLRL